MSYATSCPICKVEIKVSYPPNTNMLYYCVSGVDNLRAYDIDLITTAQYSPVLKESLDLLGLREAPNWYCQQCGNLHR